MFDWNSRTEIEKVLFFDNFYQHVNVEVVDMETLMSFLENIFKISSDILLKRQALYYLCELTIAKHYSNPFKALSLLFDIKLTDEEFLIVHAIKLLFLFYGQGEHAQEIMAAITKFQNHQNAEVTSEVNFRLGLIELENIQPSLTVTDLLQKINNTEKFFKAATLEVENRIDADFFLRLTFLQSTICINDYTAFETAYNEMLNAVLEKQIYSLEKGDIEKKGS
jgi:hypothetical protein